MQFLALHVGYENNTQENIIQFHSIFPAFLHKIIFYCITIKLKLTSVHVCVYIRGGQHKPLDPESTLAHISIKKLRSYRKGATLLHRGRQLYSQLFCTKPLREGRQKRQQVSLHNWLIWHVLQMEVYFFEPHTQSCRPGGGLPTTQANVAEVSKGSKATCIIIYECCCIKQ